MHSLRYGSRKPKIIFGIYEKLTLQHLCQPGSMVNVVRKMPYKLWNVDLENDIVNQKTLVTLQKIIPT